MYREGTFWQGSWCRWRETQAAGDAVQKLGWVSVESGLAAGGVQIRSKGRYRQMLPPSSIPSIWINWFGSMVSCIAFCPLSHLETWLCLSQPYWYCSLILGTASTGSLAGIPMALSMQDFTSASPLTVLQKQRLECLFGAAEAQWAPHLRPIGKNAPYITSHMI